MDNRAQITTEYLIIASVLIMMTVVLASLAISLAASKDALKDQARILVSGASEMVK